MRLRGFFYFDIIPDCLKPLVHFFGCICHGLHIPKDLCFRQKLQKFVKNNRDFSNDPLESDDAH